MDPWDPSIVQPVIRSVATYDRAPSTVSAAMKIVVDSPTMPAVKILANTNTLSHDASTSTSWLAIMLRNREAGNQWHESLLLVHALCRTKAGRTFCEACEACETGVLVARSPSRSPGTLQFRDQPRAAIVLTPSTSTAMPSKSRASSITKGGSSLMTLPNVPQTRTSTPRWWQ